MKRWKVCLLCAMFVVCIGLLTGCGAREKNSTIGTERNTGTLNNESSGTDRMKGSDGVNDGVNDATGDNEVNRNDKEQSGVGNAVEDLADGVGNAGSDIIDGIENAGDSLMGNDREDQTDQTDRRNDTSDNAVDNTTGME